MKSCGGELQCLSTPCSSQASSSTDQADMRYVTGTNLKSTLLMRCALAGAFLPRFAQPQACTACTMHTAIADGTRHLSKQMEMLDLVLPAEYSATSKAV